MKTKQYKMLASAQWTIPLMVVFLRVLYANASSNYNTTTSPKMDKAVAMPAHVVNETSGQLTIATRTTLQPGLQARAASHYLASRAATGLQLKVKSNKATGGQAMGDTIGLDTAIDSQMDLQTAAGEHKKYILVKKKPKHKKIKMEIYKPKMKYKKIKMKVPVKTMKKKKVKGYLVKKEKHY